MKKSATLGLFDTPADKLPQELQVLREVLYAAWESDSLARETWVKQIEARGTKSGVIAFGELLDAGVFVKDAAGKFYIDKEA